MRKSRGTLGVVCLLIDTKLPRRLDDLARWLTTLPRTNETLGNWHARCALLVEVLASSTSSLGVRHLLQD